MLYKEENQLGTITLYKDVIEAIAERAVEQFEGKVFLGNYRGKFSHLVPKLSDTLDVRMTAKGLDIRLYIVVRFGTSIKMVTEKLIGELKRQTEEVTELPVNKISVVVTAVLSKQLAKRNIEVTT